MLFVLACLLLALATFHAGFIARPPSRKSRGGFVVSLALAGFAGWLWWNDQKARAELARLIEPLPRISEIRAMPSEEVLETIARFNAAAAVLRSRRTDVSPIPPTTESRQWFVSTPLETREVRHFYRSVAARAGWQIIADTEPCSTLKRGPETLKVCCLEQPGRETTVIYLLSRTRRAG